MDVLKIWASIEAMLGAVPLIILTDISPGPDALEASRFKIISRISSSVQKMRSGEPLGSGHASVQESGGSAVLKQL